LPKELLLAKGKGDEKMTAFSFALPILPGQEDLVRSIGEMVSGSGELREQYEESRTKWTRSSGSSYRAPLQP
jgi:hypothetical protein